MPCPVGQASCHFPFRVTAEAAHAAAAAALGTAFVTTVTGYTSETLHALGASSVCLRLPLGSWGAAATPSSCIGRTVQVDAAPCFVASLRAPGRMAFLPGIALPRLVADAASPDALFLPDEALGGGILVGSARSGDSSSRGGDEVVPVAFGGDVLLEVLVLARPDGHLQEITLLAEDVLRQLLPCGASVDFRMLLPLPSLPARTAGCSAPGAAARRLADALLALATHFEGHFGAPRQPSVPLPLAPDAAETFVPDVSREELATWLASAGLTLVEDPQVAGLGGNIGFPGAHADTAPS